MRRLIMTLAAVLVGFPMVSVCGSVLLPHRSALLPHREIGADTLPNLTVPAETLISARVLTGLHTLVNHVNDPIAAEIVQPVYVSGQLALPAGTLFDGHITAIRPPRRMRRAGRLSFRFDHVTLPSGQEIPVSAVIASLEKTQGLRGVLDSEGHLEGRRKTSWKSFLTGFLTVGGLTAARVAVAGSAALSVAAPASAAAFLSYEIFLARGGNVNVPPNTRCHIRLNSSLTVQAIT
ncbi:MAG TPA: hypothetical protein VMW54_10125 [Terriglobia bacterium]|nr:hypothetical protein [Terriglobia bacterium]